MSLVSHNLQQEFNIGEWPKIFGDKKTGSAGSPKKYFFYLDNSFHTY